LEINNIGCDIHYPILDSKQSIFLRNLQIINNYSISNTENFIGKIITLPCYPELKSEEITRIISIINQWEP
jgi:dTDP-4-amino-4,6-dideoxygalactose transaminase